MDESTIEGASMGPSRSPSVEQALRELAQLAITEACLSGLCDLCLYRPDACMIVGLWREDSLPSARPEQ
jgi:hypothetical protein